GSVSGDPVALVEAAAEVSGIDQGAPAGAELRHEDGSRSRLKRVDVGEVRRLRLARHASVSGAVHGDGVANARTSVSCRIGAAAQVGGEDERAAVGANLRDERIVEACGVSGLQGIADREIGRIGLPGEVSVAGGIDTDGEAGVTVAAAAEEAGEGQPASRA